MSQTQEADIGLFKTSVPHRIIYPNIVEPRAYKQGDDPSYGATLLIPEDHQDLKDAIGIAVAVAQAKYPGRDLKTLHFPFTRGDEKADKAQANGKNRDSVRGFRLLATKSPGSRPRPNVSVLKNGRFVDLMSDEEVKANSGAFYSGVECYAVVRFKAYEGMGDGVTAYLQVLASLNKGERIGGGMRGSEVFGQHIGLDSNEDPTAGKSSVADLI